MRQTRLIEFISINNLFLFKESLNKLKRFFINLAQAAVMDECFLVSGIVSRDISWGGGGGGHELVGC